MIFDVSTDKRTNKETIMGSILIVDDVQTDREIVGRVVSSAGHRPVYASDGKEAITLAKDMHPELIFMDVVMPAQDGFKTCRLLKQDAATANIPVVLVTSKGTESDKYWGQRQGADDHVAKPFTADTIMTIIRRYAR
jgi:twitching motility two-component system response regulator PilH